MTTIHVPEDAYLYGANIYIVVRLETLPSESLHTANLGWAPTRDEAEEYRLKRELHETNRRVTYHLQSLSLLGVV